MTLLRAQGRISSLGKNTGFFPRFSTLILGGCVQNNSCFGYYWVLRNTVQLMGKGIFVKTKKQNLLGKSAVACVCVHAHLLV